MPVSQEYRKRWAEKLTNLAAEYAIYSGTPHPDAWDSSVSVIRDFFESAAFKGWLKNREGEHKMQAAVVGRLDALIRSIGELGKAISRR